MGIHEAAILTDNLLLAKAAAARDPNSQPGYWIIRGLLTDFCALTASSDVQIFHVSRNHNTEAHEAAKLAYSQEFHPNQKAIIKCSTVEYQQWHYYLEQIIADVLQQGYAINHVNCCYFE